jgi:hypothetical protein
MSADRVQSSPRSTQFAHLDPTVCLVAFVLSACGSGVTTGQANHRSSDAAAATVAYPDLQVMIPTSVISIGHPTSTTRELRFTHITWNGGAGPLEIRPAYDATTGTAQGYQRLYTYDASGTLTPVQDVPIVDPMVWVPPSDYKFPLSQFGLYSVAADGSVGAPVAMSPKIQFCMAEDYLVGGLPDTPPSVVYNPSNCSSPTGTLGLSVGWGDQYDYTDFGENIDITAVPDGTYWLRAVANPYGYLQESSFANNATDTKLTIAGDVVTIVSQTHPDSTPPAVSVTQPAPGTSVSGLVTVTATASAGATSVQFLLDGRPLGPLLASAPYSYTWDTSTAAVGSHLLSAQSVNAAGFIGTAPAVAVSVPQRIGTFVVDQMVSVDGIGTVQTAAFVTSVPNELLLALVGADGPTSSQSVVVSGAGLTWTRLARANADLGTAEIWSAFVPASATSVTVTSTESAPGYPQSLTVVALQNAAGTGATRTAGSTSGAPSLNLLTTQSGSWVVAVGNDWDAAIARAIGPGQQVLHQDLETAFGNTFWMQATNGTASGGGSVTVNDTAPMSDRWNLAAVEVLAAGSAPPPPDTQPPTVTIVNPANGQVVSGPQVIAATAVDNVAVSSVQFLLDGSPLGSPIPAGASYSMTWDTTTATNGTHTIGAQATDTSGNVGTATPVTVTVGNPTPPMVCFIVDVQVSKDGRGPVTTPVFHTALPGELLLAFGASDGPQGGSQTLSVSGAGLSWKLVKRANAQAGTAEIWAATAATALTGAQVTANQTKGGYDMSLTVIAVQGAAGTGAAAAASARSGPPTVTLTTTKVASLVYGVGNDWDNAIARTVGTNQLLDHQWLDTATGDAFWVQNLTSPTGQAGSVVTLNDTAPTSDRWNFAAVEILGE